MRKTLHRAPGRPRKKEEEKHSHIYQVPANGADCAQVNRLKRQLKIDGDAELFRHLLHGYNDAHGEQIKTREQLREVYLAIKDMALNDDQKKDVLRSLKQWADLLVLKGNTGDMATKKDGHAHKG